MPADRVVPRYVADEGPGNVLVGHRRQAGRRLPVRVHRFDRHSYGNPALTWEVEGSIEPGAYDVAVSRIRGAASAEHSYAVRIFDPQA